MGGAPEIEQLRAALTARDAELAVERARRVELEAQVAKLTEAVSALQELVGRNSSNSNKPPSSDGPGVSTVKKKPKGGRRGGQKGHRGSHRFLVPAEQVHTFVELFACECENCWEPLPKTHDPPARRYQYTELKPLAAHVTEYRRHAVVCPSASA